MRQQRHEELMEALMGGEGSDTASLFGTPTRSPSTAGTHFLHASSIIDLRAAMLKTSIYVWLCHHGCLHTDQYAVGL